MIISEKHIKALVFMILVYQHFYAEAFGQIPFLLTGLYIALDVVFVTYNISKFRRIRLSSACTWLAFFMIYAVLFGFFVTSYRSAFLTNIVYLVEYVVLLLTVCEVTKKEKNPGFFIVTMFCISLMGILLALYRQQYIFNRLVISLHSNANSLGNLCIICVCTGIYIAFTFKKGWLALLLSLPITFYVAILTASKKALLISALVLLLYIMFRYKDWLREHFIGIALITMLTALLVFLNRNQIIHAWETTTVYTRIQRSSDIDVGRITLYEEAFNAFKAHPIFGVGYRCFQFYSSSGLYSHSAYAEVLAGTGIIGILLWGTFYLKTFFNSMILALHNRRNLILLWSFVWILCQMLLDLTSVSLNTPLNMALLGVVIAITENREFYQAG